jgi:transposase
MFRPKVPDAPALWIATTELPQTPAGGFYQRLDGALRKIGFGDAVRTLCAPYYEADGGQGGRPGIDPEVYFKMQMVGFFEHLRSERGIAARCADSLAIRAFLHYGLTEATPDHSTLTVIRQRLTPEVFQGVFALVLRALKKHHLLRGTRLTLDTSVLEANASLASLEHRLTGEAYAEYVAALAAAAGIDPNDAAAVRRFDRKRPDRTTSNKDWTNPHDPDAKVGPTKRGATRMIYKPEHGVDLETGAIVDVDVRPGDEHDTADLTTRVFAMQDRLNEALGVDPQTTMALLVADKGYYKVEELVDLQAAGVQTAIRDPLTNRRVEKLTEIEQRAVRAAARTCALASVKALAKRRGEFGERSFTHVMDVPGARRTTLRGRDNILKRYLIQAASVNLSLLMRKLIGVGTAKQAADVAGGVLPVVKGLVRALGRVVHAIWRWWRFSDPVGIARHTDGREPPNVPSQDGISTAS